MPGLRFFMIESRFAGVDPSGVKLADVCAAASGGPWRWRVFTVARSHVGTSGTADLARLSASPA
ncbi:hypothetical protein AMK13_04510 [Streptomyces sp. CB02056]|nr:hypothetical protein AMK13_04510 [Streptomyces sp. CB02056]